MSHSVSDEPPHIPSELVDEIINYSASDKPMLTLWTWSLSTICSWVPMTCFKHLEELVLKGWKFETFKEYDALFWFPLQSHITLKDLNAHSPVSALPPGFENHHTNLHYLLVKIPPGPHDPWTSHSLLQGPLHNSGSWNVNQMEAHQTAISWDPYLEPLVHPFTHWGSGSISPILHRQKVKWTLVMSLYI